ncbi:hypothetical protein P171DRAFT_478295 [Karstenula rhodostoma CBS 690.94]|uniref:Uncharacterized protein n=1 Tax=Karstenula rhodostoma CBS 690.94 TaxID=1392251 RepID=A0A9P4PW03_9PLEO|nr:hypothetical protein P171DRAFT_478295 [Karstenula rhodostoma CBS 690.94]
MEYGVRPINPYSPDRLSGYFDAFVHNTQTMHNLNTWVPTLNNLRGQKDYLEGLLSKTVTTLNALRDRQTRNQRILDTNPTPRTKRKKIQQDRWRTSKTIRTCENEEKVILDCLQVCENNIHTLEAIICPPESSWNSVEYYGSNSYGDSDTTSFDWQGWTDDVAVSPFEQTRKGPLPLDEIAPDMTAGCTQAEIRRPSPLPPQSILQTQSAFLVAPLNSAYTDFTLSPEAAAFKPSTAHLQLPITQLARELDRLTISGLLASKRMHSIRSRRFSDEAVAFRCLSSTVQPTPTRTGSCSSWPGQSPSHGKVDGGSADKTKLKRCNSI